ncbi:MAG: DUF3466 family protein [Planctomycetes bacterium]|nr:DUF3466 family protein [Planctomycetota bacterium]
MSNKSNKHLVLTTACLVICLFAASNSVCAQVPCGGYEVTAIIQSDECPPFGFPGMVPDGMNDLGWVVGHFNACVIGPDVSWLWTPESGLELLEMPPGSSQSRAIDINNHPDRQIVGTVDISDIGGTRAFLIDGEDLILIHPPNDGTFSSVAALNDQRQIVGLTADGTPFGKAYIWEDGAMTIIEPTFGPKSAAWDINEAGVVVGWMGNSQLTDARAFIWEAGRMTLLPPIPGGSTSDGSAINDLRQVVGYGVVKNDVVILVRAFLWENNQYTDLGTLPGLDSCAAIDINNSSTVIGECGQSDIPNSNQPYVWNKGVMINLNDLIPEGAGITIREASAINNSGQIVARALNADNDTVAVILTPIKGPLADLNGDCAVSVADLLILFASWGPCDDCGDCAADLNGDCTVSTLDLLILFSNWV